jgi:hypothetical protein
MTTALRTNKRFYIFFILSGPLLITRREGRHSYLTREKRKPDCWQMEMTMNDFIYLAVIALFFVASGLYARWCEKL